MIRVTVEITPPHNASSVTVVREVEHVTMGYCLPQLVSQVRSESAKAAAQAVGAVAG